MPDAVEYEVPGDEQIYDRVKAAIGQAGSEGLIVHLVVKNPSGLRHVEVWESKESWERFRDEEVQPAVAAV